jgi:hypothetical protein
MSSLSGFHGAGGLDLDQGTVEVFQPGSGMQLTIQKRSSFSPFSLAAAT